MSSRRTVLAARTTAVVLALGGLIGWSASDVDWGEEPSLEGPARSGVTGALTPSEEELVESAGLGCAGVGDLAGSLRAASAPPELLDALGAASPADEPEQPDAGSTARLRTVGVDPEPGAGAEEVIEPGGRWGQVDLEPGAGAVIEGQRASAPGLTAGQLAVGTAAGARGAVMAPCVQGAESLWLVGGDGGAGRSEQVVLTNPGSDPVQVQLDVRDTGGVVDLVGGSGVVVPARSQVVQVLDALAPGANAPAVRVTSTDGLVVAHLVDQDQDGTRDLGRSVSAPVAEPARDLVIPALPTEGAELQLRVVAPEAQALVEIRALTQDGAANPDTAALRVPAGATADLPLEGLAEGAVGFRLSSDVPVTAAVQLRKAPSSDDPIEDESTEGSDAVVRPAGDLAWVGATPLLSTPAAFAVAQLPQADLATLPDARRQLSLSAVDATTAQVLWLDQEGRTGTEEISLGNDSSVLVDVPEETAALWVYPLGASGVAAALHLSAQDALGPYVAATTLPAVPWTRTVTDVLRLVP